MEALPPFFYWYKVTPKKYFFITTMYTKYIFNILKKLKLFIFGTLPALYTIDFLNGREKNVFYK